MTFQPLEFPSKTICYREDKFFNEINKKDEKILRSYLTPFLKEGQNENISTTRFTRFLSWV
jgi:hypothetical protein